MGDARTEKAARFSNEKGSDNCSSRTTDTHTPTPARVPPCAPSPTALIPPRHPLAQCTKRNSSRGFQSSPGEPCTGGCCCQSLAGKKGERRRQRSRGLRGAIASRRGGEGSVRQRAAEREGGGELSQRRPGRWEELFAKAGESGSWDAKGEPAAPAPLGTGESIAGLLSDLPAVSLQGARHLHPIPTSSC